jgi:hypothetical protein
MRRAEFSGMSEFEGKAESIALTEFLLSLTPSGVLSAFAPQQLPPPKLLAFLR